MIPVSVKLAWREIQSAWSRFLFLFLCIALGVGAIVAVDLFAVNVAQVIYGLPLVCKQDFILMREGSAVIYPAS